MQHCGVAVAPAKRVEHAARIEEIHYDTYLIPAHKEPRYP